MNEILTIADIQNKKIFLNNELENLYAKNITELKQYNKKLKMIGIPLTLVVISFMIWTFNAQLSPDISLIFLALSLLPLICGIGMCVLPIMIKFFSPNLHVHIMSGGNDKELKNMIHDYEYTDLKTQETCKAYILSANMKKWKQHLINIEAQNRPLTNHEATLITNDWLKLKGLKP